MRRWVVVSSLSLAVAGPIMGQVPADSVSADTAALSPGDREGPSTLLTGSVRTGFFVAPDMKLSAIGEQFAVFPGLRLGFLMNNTFALGLGGSILANDISLLSGGGRDLDFYYGGLLAELFESSNRVVHGGIRILGGPGLVKVKTLDAEAEPAGGGEATDPEDPGSEKVLVLEPAADLIVNLTSMLRVALGAGYRWVWGVDSLGLANEDLTRWFGMIAFQIGKF